MWRILCAALLLTLVSCQSTMTDLNVTVPKASNTAFELIEFVEPYFAKEAGDNFLIGGIWMFLEKDLNGKVEFTFVEGKSNVYIANIDTVKQKLVNIKYLGNDSKINPGSLSINEWKIDSDVAIKIALKAFNNIRDFKYDKVIIHTNNNYHKKIELWEVEFHDLEKNKKYWCTINPRDGLILHQGIKDFND
jgi:hypothetical protein